MRLVAFGPSASEVSAVNETRAVSGELGKVSVLRTQPIRLRHRPDSRQASRAAACRVEQQICFARRVDANRWIRPIAPRAAEPTSPNELPGRRVDLRNTNIVRVSRWRAVLDLAAEV